MASRSAFVTVPLVALAGGLVVGAASRGVAAPKPAVSASPSVTVLASGRCGPDSVAVDATHVYFHDGCDSQAMQRVDKGGGVSTLLAVRTGAVVGLETDHVLVASGATPSWTGTKLAELVAYPKIGGLGVPRFASFATGVTDVRIDAVGVVYAQLVADRSHYELFARPALPAKIGETLPSFGKPVRLTTAQHATYVRDAESAYVLFSFSPQVLVRARRDGTGSTVLVRDKTGFGVGGLLLDGDDVVYSTASRLMRVAKDGGAPKAIADLVSDATRLTLSGDTIYFLAGVGEGRSIYRVPKVGGVAKRLPLPTANVVAFAIDGDFVVYADDGSGRIARAPR